MILLPDDIRVTLPPLYATENTEDPLARVRFFTPWSYWTWYATEFDGEDTFFGLVFGHEVEYGYFGLKELGTVRGPGGLTVERDLHFTPATLSAIRQRERC